MKILMRKQFGNPILRQVTQKLSAAEIASEKIQRLIADMRYTLENRKYGVGLAAPQVGYAIALSVIGIKPTPSRPDSPRVDMIVINPEIVRFYGQKAGLWEGCISFGVGANAPYAQALRNRKVRVRYVDEHGQKHEKDFEGILAHVLQHEIDHLNGILFVDRVVDSKTYMTISEYEKRHESGMMEA